MIKKEEIYTATICIQIVVVQIITNRLAEIRLTETNVNFDKNNQCLFKGSE